MHCCSRKPCKLRLLHNKLPGSAVVLLCSTHSATTHPYARQLRNILFYLSCSIVKVCFDTFLVPRSLPIACSHGLPSCAVHGAYESPNRCLASLALKMVAVRHTISFCTWSPEVQARSRVMRYQCNGPLLRTFECKCSSAAGLATLCYQRSFQSRRASFIYTSTHARPHSNERSRVLSCCRHLETVLCPYMLVVVLVMCADHQVTVQQ